MARPRKTASGSVNKAAGGTKPATSKPAEAPEAEGTTAASVRHCPVTGLPVKGKSAFAGPGSDAKAKSLLNKMLASSGENDGDYSEHDEAIEAMAHPEMFRDAIEELVEADIAKIAKPTPVFHPEQDISLSEAVAAAE